MLDDEFILVPYRKACRRRPHRKTVLDDDDGSDVDCDVLIRKLLDMESELKNSHLGESMFDKLKESLNTLDINMIDEILCYGLGQFSVYPASKCQLAFLMYLKKYYDVKTSYVYDPKFNAKEIEVLEKLEFRVIDTNEEGRRTVTDKITLVYLPHCPHYLTNNFLYANWSKDLSNCIIIGNSFNHLSTRKKNKQLPDTYIVRIEPFTKETILLSQSIASEVHFYFRKAFTSTSIHTFPKDGLNGIPDTFWEDRKEPIMSDYDEELIGIRETKGFASQSEAPSTSSRDLDHANEMNPNLQIIRSLVKEIRHCSRDGKVKDNIMVQYILEQARAHRPTSEVLCKAREELKNLAETYHCYLSSARLCNDIHVRYAGKGERSIKETADLVGFKLPHDPK